MAIGNLANTDGNFIVGNGTTWVAESGSTVRTSLGLGQCHQYVRRQQAGVHSQQTALDLKANLSVTVNAQTGTSYTLLAADAGAVVTMSNASANVLNIPTNTTLAFPIGTVVNVVQIGAGITTVDGVTGVTVNGVSGGGAAISARYAGVSILKIATNTWLMSGAHGTVT